MKGLYTHTQTVDLLCATGIRGVFSVRTEIFFNSNRWITLSKEARFRRVEKKFHSL